MSKFDQLAWKRGQSAQAGQDKRLAGKLAALAKKSSGRKGGSRSLTSFKRTPVGRATKGQGSWTSNGKTPPLILKINAGGKAGDGYAERQPGAQFIDSNMMGRDAWERRAEFELDTKQHPRVDPKNIFVHVSFSRPPGEDLTPHQWRRGAREFLKKIGAEGCQYVCTRHTETKCDHLHLVFSRSRPDGTLVSMSNNRWSWRAALREVEAELNITAAERPSDRPTASTSDAQVNAARRAQRRGTLSGYIDARVLSQVLSLSTTPAQFSDGLKAAGILVKKAEKNGKVIGILFQHIGADDWLAGSTISREFSLPKLLAKFEFNRQALQDQDLLLQRRQQELQQQLRQAAQRPNYDWPRGG